jgi:hypothetical protein
MPKTNFKSVEAVSSLGLGISETKRSYVFSRPGGSPYREAFASRELPW